MVKKWLALLQYVRYPLQIPSRIDEAPGLSAYHRHPMPGGNSSVLTSAVRDAGGFDPWFSSYGWQDQEFAQRLLANGLQRRFAWRAPIYHFKPASYDVDLRAQLEREFHRGRMGARFYHKHRTVAIGITTKAWAPLRLLIAVASNVARIDDLRAAVTRGEVDGRAVSPWRAALLRARAESEAASVEMRRLSSRDYVPNAVSSLECHAPSGDAAARSHTPATSPRRT